MDTSEQVSLDETPNQIVRRRRSVEEKRRIVEETLETGASVARVARRHAVNANQVFYWRKKFREGRLATYGTRYHIKMGCFGRSWQPFVQQNVQRAEFCATGLLAPSLVANC